MNKSICLALALALAAHALLFGLPAQASTKRLVFASIDSNSLKPFFLEPLLSDPDLDGLSVDLRWRFTEPQKGFFDWSKLDRIIAAAARHRKLVSINFAGTPKVPDWLTNEKIQFVASASLSRSFILDPVPWDETYLGYYKKFLQAASAHLKQMNMTPYVFAVGMVAPSRSITLLDCRHGKLGEVAYDRKKYLNACSEMIDAYHLYFPNARQLISAPRLKTICSPDEDESFFEELMNNALRKYGQSCWVLVTDLKSNSSEVTESMKSFVGRTGFGFHLDDSGNGSGTYALGGSLQTNVQQAIKYGINHGAIYLEVQYSDALSADPAVKAAIKSIHQ